MVQLNSVKSKIAIIDYTGSKAGMDYYSLELLNALSKKGLDTFYFSNTNSGKSGNCKIEKCFSTKTPQFTGSKIIDYFFGFIRAYRKCKIAKCDFVILHFFSASFKEFITILLSKLFNIKVILIVHDVSSFAERENTWARSKIFDFASKIVVHNKFSFNEIVKNISSINKNKISIIKHGNFINLVNTEVSKDLAREKLNLDKNITYLLFFGQIKKVKGLDVLLNALPYTDSSIQLIIAGKPWKNDFEQYQQLINEHNLQNKVIMHIHYISDEEREYFFKACDILVLPYQKIYQSGVLLMGMSYSLPIVVSSLEPNLEIINDGQNGLSFETNNPLSLAEKINNLTLDRKFQRSLGACAYQTVLNDYSWDLIATEYINVIQCR